MTEKRRKIYWSILEKTVEDNEFRNAVLADARSAIRKEFDLQVPESINIVVHENDSSTIHLPLPAKPKVLSEGSLRQVAGGFCSNTNLCAGCAACI